MSKALVQVVNGIKYPREVAMPAGMPDGWIAVEQAYGPGSKKAGTTYVRYRSADGRHRQVMGPKQVVQLHCQDNGIEDWESVYAKYTQALKARQDKDAEERAKEREARGQFEGEQRERMIAVSREHFGELSGAIVFGFPGWKCRWDFLPDSQQTPKTFTDPDGREWKLLKDLECKFGSMIESAGGKVPEDLARMIQAGKDNKVAHTWFSSGSQKAKECEGAVELDAATAEAKIETKEEVALRKQRNKGKRTTHVEKKYYVQRDDYQVCDIKVRASGPGFTTNPAASLRDLLLARGFKRKDTMILEVAVTSQAKHRYADVITGFYFLQCKDDTDRPCFQRVKLSTGRQGASVVVGMDMYLCWHGPNERWEFTCRKPGKACFAFSTEQKSDPCGIGSWKLLRDNFGRDEVKPETADVDAGRTVVATPPEPSPKKRKSELHGTQGDSAVDTSKQTPSEGASPSESEDRKKPSQDDSTKKDAERTGNIPWPADVTPIDPSLWETWLPDGWGQGTIVIHTTGKEKKVFINPQGRKKYSKPEVLKSL
eukprot:TRINITY_DN24763_c0_g1_i1.p1 TRINITY_DN24763_c0_g1~~TRINITY_DN24763_c0_g1_i1.p1  ORF type:complete len:541 (+),score=85.75 TRINITY_DN24763_c0_g1_i1:145-1767(+)